MTKADQTERQRGYPENRIAFLERAASTDRINFGKFIEGQITLIGLCKRVAEANLLDECFPNGIPEKMMIAELEICGWM